jgi:predicted alpha/beta-fold hydrolase
VQGSADITLIDSNYRSPWWLPGGHLQTIYAPYRCGLNQLDYRRERWETPDGDFIDLDWIDAERNDAKLLVLFHGLEDCSRSHYALTLMSMARQRGWRGVVPHFRSCSGEPNRLARAYHSGDTDEIDWILSTFREIDDLYTAPLHGFKNAEDYWIRSSSKQWLKHIEVPTLLLNARNDPFLPPLAFPGQKEVSPVVETLYPDCGGHVGFVSGGFAGEFRWLPERILRFFGS